ncbi:hypothetical protein HanIR_Chr03g0144231 [Helianthus annuus]|nr:hypothetical protein HanIR_Chr03g0144231 [Helianthus annuus]
MRSTLKGVWSNICKVCSKQLGDNISLRSLMQGEVGDGSEIFIWLDPWLLPKPLKEELPNLFRLELDKKCRVKDQIVSLVSNPSGRWEWRANPDSNEELAEWNYLCSLLHPVSLTVRKDRWKWLGEGAGRFSVGAVKRLFELSSDYSSRFVWDWCRWLPKKCNLFAWRAELDRIPTRVALQRRNIHVEEYSCRR